MRRIVLKYMWLSFVLIIVGCDYSKDKLIIHNNSKRKIYYTTLLKSKDDNTYFSNSGGGHIEINGFSHPIIRQSISSTIDQQSSEKILYIVYFDYKDHDFVFKNIKTILTSQKVKVKKYSKEQLESLNWELEFNDE